MQDTLVGPCAEDRRFLSDVSRCCAGSNRPSLQLTVWTCTPEDTPAHQALQCHIDLSLGHLPHMSWRRCPGRPRNRWLDHTPPADLYRRAVMRGHSGWRYIPRRLCVNDDDDDYCVRQKRPHYKNFNIFKTA